MAYKSKSAGTTEETMKELLSKVVSKRRTVLLLHLYFLHRWFKIMTYNNVVMRLLTMMKTMDSFCLSISVVRSFNLTQHITHQQSKKPVFTLNITIKQNLFTDALTDLHLVLTATLPSSVTERYWKGKTIRSTDKKVPFKLINTYQMFFLRLRARNE